MKEFVRSTALLALLATTACGGGGGAAAATPSVNVAGNYTGPLSDNTVGPGSITLALSQSGSSLSGTFQDTFTNAPQGNNAGTVSGSISGSTIQLTATSSNPNACPFSVTATVGSSGQIQGTYAAKRCSTADGGSFTVTQQ